MPTSFSSLGEAFVQFASAEGCALALKKDHQNLGHRYVEVYQSNGAERDKVCLAFCVVWFVLITLSLWWIAG
jgi:hypothetical protein